MCASLLYADRPHAVDVHHLDGLGPLGPHGHDPENLAAFTHGHHSSHTASENPHPFTSRGT